MKITVLILTAITVISLFSCGGGSNKPRGTTAETTSPDTTEAETTAPETTTEAVTTDPNAPIYEDGGFTYKIDVRNYLQYICPSNESDYLIIANRKHPLGSNYVPKNLVNISSSNSRQLVNTAKMALEAMCNEMRALKVYDTNPQSAYRSYSYQYNLYYNKYMVREREKYPHLSNAELMIIVDTYSARPGTSDHQTGLTIDFSPINSSFSNTKAFKYLKENAHKFGFIMRYPKGKENITGYKYEPWHWRFVGRDVATYIYEHGITLEEYMAEVNDTVLETFPEVEMPPLTPPATTEKETTAPDTTEAETTLPDTTVDGTTADETTVDETTAETTPEETTTGVTTTTEEITTTEETTAAETTTEAEVTTEAETTDAEITE